MSATLISMPSKAEDLTARETIREVVRDSCANYMAYRFRDFWDSHPEMTLNQVFEEFPRFSIFEDFTDYITEQFNRC